MKEKDCSELELLVNTLIEEKNREELLDLPWAGNLGTWVWTVPSNRVVCNSQKILNLGYAEDEIPEYIGFEFFTDLLHPNDYDPVMNQMRRHLAGIDSVYEVQYRIKHKDGSWRWYYDRGKITKRDEQGKPLILVGIVFDITQQKHMEEQLERKNRQLKHMVDHDALTGILSRRALFSILKRALVQNQEDETSSGSSLVVLMIDIDHFKRVNDVHGHVVGDAVLVEVAQIIQQSIRNSDWIGRYGGEEFLVILENTHVDQAYEISERIRANISQHIFTEGLHLTISGGLARADGRHVDSLLQIADQRLYAAKNGGRNKIVQSEHS